jgi:hypothetical protein
MEKRIFLFLAVILFSSSVYALEIDEKLTLRVLNISRSRKTVLINRGVEDGLVQGDHAKFFITVGVIARGVVIKVSPTRSVWSLYRVVNADYIKPDSVINLKVTAPVKITLDESKMVVKDDTPAIVGLNDPRKLGIPLSEGADDLGNIQLSGGVNEAELKALAGANITNIRDRNLEVWGGVVLSNYSVATNPGTGGNSYASSQLNLDIMAGGEYYFKKEKNWYGRFSFLAFLKTLNTHLMSADGEQVQSSTKEIGGGVNWHPLKRPSAVNQFIPFGTVNIFYGSIQDTYTGGANASVDQTIHSGTLFGYSVGAGLKFYTGQGYGFRVILDYFQRTDTFVSNDYGEAWSRTSSGPRGYMAASYRF